MKKLYNNICIIISIIALLVFFGEIIYSGCVKCLGMLVPTENFMSATVGVIAVILSIAFPIIVGNVSQSLKPYKSEYIANIFKQESAYRAMRFIIFLLIISLLFFIFFKNPAPDEGYYGIERFIGFMILALGVSSIIVFHIFTRRFTDYVVNTDKVLLGQLKKREIKLNYDGSDFGPHLQIIQEYGRICVQKVEIEDYDHLILVLQSMDNILKKSYSGIKIQNAERENILAPLAQNVCDIYYKLWYKTYSSSPVTANMIMQQYEILLGEIIKMNMPTDNIINSGSNGIFFTLFQRVANEIDNDVAKKEYRYMQYVWEWYFYLLADKKFDIAFTRYMNMYLFLTMKIVVNYDHRHVFNSFIEATIDRWICPNDMNLPTNFDPNLLEKIDEIRFGMPLAFTFRDYNSYFEIYEQIRRGIGETHGQDMFYIGRLKNFIDAYFKYNNLSLVVSILGAYCLFKNRIDYVCSILYFNQPKESVAHFGNKDIVPDSVMIVLHLYFNKHFILPDYMILWGQHNDPHFWFDKYLALLFCRIILNNGKLSYNIKYWGEGKQDLEQTAMALENFRNLIEETDIKLIFGGNDELGNIKSKAIHLIDQMIKSTGIAIDKTEIAQELDEEKVNNFKNSVCEKINDHSVWKSILRHKGTVNEGFETFEFPIGFKQVIKKSFLAKGDVGLYFNFEQGFAELVIDQIDNMVEYKIVEFAHRYTKGKVFKVNLKEKIFTLDSNYIVVFVNTFKIYDLLQEDKGFQWKNKGYLIGYTSKKTAIYLFTNRGKGSSRMYIFNKHDVSQVIITGEKFEIIDLNKNKNLRDEILTSQPFWLRQEASEKQGQEKFLCKSIEIDYDAQISFSIKKDINIDYLENV